MGALHDVMRFVALYGPARNDSEREHLLGLIEADERASQPPEATEDPGTSPDPQGAAEQPPAPTSQEGGQL